MNKLQQFYPVLDKAKARTHIDAATYDAMYQQSIEQPDEFWSEQALKFIDWTTPFDNVSSINFNCLFFIFLFHFKILNFTS